MPALAGVDALPKLAEPVIGERNRFADDETRLGRDHERQQLEAERASMTKLQAQLEAAQGEIVKLKSKDPPS